MRLSMKRMRKNYLNRELFILSLVSFGIALLVYFVLSVSSTYLITRYYNTEEHIEKLEKKICKRIAGVYYKRGNYRQKYRGS